MVEHDPEQCVLLAERRLRNQTIVMVQSTVDKMFLVVLITEDDKGGYADEHAFALEKDAIDDYLRRL